MKFRFTIVLLALGLCLFAGIQSDKTGLLSSFGWAGEKNAIASIDSKQLKKAIHLSAGYLTKQCTDTGIFLYRINVEPAITPKPRYNFLRHAGSIYALASYDQTYPHKITKNA